MKINLYLFLAVCCCAFGLSENSYGQTTVTDSASSANIALANANNLFNKSIGEQSALFNGPEYYFYNPVLFKGSPNFLEKPYVLGNVCYEGVEYRGVNLLYDLYKNELVSLLYGKFLNYKLVNKKVQNFDLMGHHFININADSLGANSVLKGGYYDELYHGKMQVIAKLSKDLRLNVQEVGSTQMYSLFNPASMELYLKKDGAYYHITSQDALLDVLKDHKKQVQQYIRSAKMKYRKQPDQTLVSAATYYDHLSN